eukprot:g14045.t1
MSAEPAMLEGGFAKDRSAVAGLEAAILDVLSDNTTDSEWGACLQAPYERAAAAGDVPLAIALLRAGAKGSHLHPAVRGGHDDLVKELLKLGASPTAKDDHGDAPLHIAASLGRTGIVKTLLATEGVDELEVDAKGRTPAHLACWKGDEPTAEALIASTGGNWRSGGSHRLGKTKIGFTPYDLAVRSNNVGVKEVLRGRWPTGEASSLMDGELLHEAAEQDNVPMIDFLVGEANTNVDSRGECGFTPLHSAALKGASKAMAALVKHGADASALDERGRTPLHTAASGGHPAAIDVLCTADGVDVNLRVYCFFGSYPPEEDTWSALDFAAIEGNVDAFKTLLRHGADWKALSDEGLTVLNTAAASNNTELIDVLIELGAPVEGPEGGGSTPLYTATGAYSPEAVRALVRYGANVTKKPERFSSRHDNDPPLCDALTWGHRGSDVVKILLESGARPNDMPDDDALDIMFEWCGQDGDILESLLRSGAEIREPNSFGDYLLHQAVEMSHGAKGIELLAKAGAEVNAASSRGLTPLQMACSRANGPAIAALVRHGAAIDVVDGKGNSPLHLAAVAEGSQKKSQFSMMGDEPTEVPTTSGVHALLKADAEWTVINAKGHTPHDRVRLELADRDAHRESAGKVLQLLERAPIERAWRNRSPWVLCRTFPEKVRVGRNASRRPKVQRVDEGDAGGSEGDREDSDGPADEEGGGDFTRLSAWVLEHREEGIFRAVISFL